MLPRKIERDPPRVGVMTDEQVRKATLEALDVFEELGERIQWVRSYVTEDKAYCIYSAAAETLVREHVEKRGIPQDRISEVRRMMQPIRAAAVAGTA
ncbi:MAG: nickel-binding protein [Rhodanobacteraceae bacterium]